MPDLPKEKELPGLAADFRSGFVSLVGPPNGGKSTLLNALLGVKVSIVTPKAQTTRHRVLGILTQAQYQMVFTDTPGVIAARYDLQARMMQAVGRAVEDAEVVAVVVPADRPQLGPELLQLLQTCASPQLLILNKLDLVTPEEALAALAALQAQHPFQGSVALAALKRVNLQGLLTALRALLPPGPHYYDADQLTDKTERFMAAERIREQVFLQYEEEVPYATEVQILEWRQEEGRMYIHAEIHVERRTQKAILIGNQGHAIKALGTAARRELEQWLGQPVYLQLYVRVAEDWKRSGHYLRQFGYDEA